MIREFPMSDTEQVMKLWLSGNIDAHSFVPEEYWRSHFDEVQEALLQAKVVEYEHIRWMGLVVTHSVLLLTGSNNLLHLAPFCQDAS